ncbi:sugar 3,4-ketoisomerase [Treponema primitia]|uniref:sugar 3,4-ketoisomerase n=1 Tax=Treponema primitia TaxID=88058 RepID=UPI0002554ED2|nr:FdtA/QdtA family cupin domain-containing protein [Treponema primitia]
MNNHLVENPKIIELPKVLDKRGNLSFFENVNQIPFAIKRTYWIYDVPGGESRGGHAYHENEEFIVALSGSFDVILDDGIEKETYSLNRSYYGLYVPQLYWREMNNFSTNSLALIVSNTQFEENDYIRDYEVFLLIKNDK